MLTCVTNIAWVFITRIYRISDNTAVKHLYFDKLTQVGKLRSQHNFSFVRKQCLD